MSVLMKAVDLAAERADLRERAKADESVVCWAGMRVDVKDILRVAMWVVEKVV